MNSNGLGFLKVSLDEGAFLPTREHKEDAGADLRTPYSFKIAPHSRVPIKTGVHVEIPKGYVGYLKSKSGLNVKKGILCTGVIDAGYSGEIVACLYNLSDTEVEFEVGDKITQLVIEKVETPEIIIVDTVEGLSRGDNGFGSTGK